MGLNLTLQTRHLDRGIYFNRNCYNEEEQSKRRHSEKRNLTRQECRALLTLENDRNSTKKQTTKQTENMVQWPTTVAPHLTLIQWITGICHSSCDGLSDFGIKTSRHEYR